MLLQLQPPHRRIGSAAGSPQHLPPSQTVGHGSSFALCSPEPCQGRSPSIGRMARAATALCLRELHLVPLKLTLPQDPPFHPSALGMLQPMLLFIPNPPGSGIPCTLPHAPLSIHRQWEFFPAAAGTALETCTDFQGQIYHFFIFGTHPQVPQVTQAGAGCRAVQGLLSIQRLPAFTKHY